MATPHVAGSAAVVIAAASDLDRGRHPLGHRQHGRPGRAQGRASTGTNVVDDPNIVGAGLVNLLKAVRATVSLDPVSIAFGGVPVGSGQTLRRGSRQESTPPTRRSRSRSRATAGGVVHRLARRVTLAPGQTTTINVGVAVPRGNTLGDDWARLIVSMNGAEVAHAALYTRTR